MSLTWLCSFLRTVGPPDAICSVMLAIIAAIFLDGGMEPAKAFILKHLEPICDEIANSAHQQNFKSVLQQHAQRELEGHPQYILLDEKGPDHAKCFEVCVDIDKHRYPSAWANSKKEAEQKAALLALEQLGVVEVGEDDHVTMCIEEDDDSLSN